MKLAGAFLALVRKFATDLDVEKLRLEMVDLSLRQPDLTTREKARHVVRTTARRAAALGAAASLPPGWTALAAVGPELSALLILQSRMIVGLHLLYGGMPDPEERAL